MKLRLLYLTFFLIFSNFSFATPYNCTVGMGEYLDNGDYIYNPIGQFETLESEGEYWGQFKAGDHRIACGTNDEYFLCFILYGQTEKLVASGSTERNGPLSVLAKMRQEGLSESRDLGVACVLADRE